MNPGAENLGSMDVVEIRKILPHRYPFLMIDRMLYVRPGEEAIGLKAVTINEEFFQGHFPAHPVMPAVLITESMAQVGGVLLLTVAGSEGKIAYFTGIDKQRFRKPVLPGDLLVTRVTMIGAKGYIGKVRAEAYVFRLQGWNAAEAKARGDTPALPGNSVSLLEESEPKPRTWLYAGMEGEMAAEGELMFALVDADRQPGRSD